MLLGIDLIGDATGALEATSDAIHTMSNQPLLGACLPMLPIQAVGASERVFAYLDAPPAPQIAAGIVPTEAAAAADEAAAAAAADGAAAGSKSGGLWVRSDGRPLWGGKPSGGGADGLHWQLELKGVDFSYPSRPGKSGIVSGWMMQDMCANAWLLECIPCRRCALPG